MLWLLETACFWIPHQAPIVEHWIWWNNLTAAALRNWPRHGAPILLKTLNFQLGPNQMIPQPKSRLLWPKSSQIPSQSQPPRPHHFFPSFYLRQPLLQTLLRLRHPWGHRGSTGTFHLVVGHGDLSRSADQENVWGNPLRWAFESYPLVATLALVICTKLRKFFVSLFSIQHFKCPHAPWSPFANDNDVPPLRYN